MSKYKTGDRFIIEVEKIEGYEDLFKVKGHGMITIFNEQELDKLKKINEKLPEGYKKAIMKKFTEVR